MMASWMAWVYLFIGLAVASYTSLMDALSVWKCLRVVLFWPYYLWLWNFSEID